MTGAAQAVLTACTLPTGVERRKPSGSLLKGAPSKPGRNLVRMVIARSGLTHRGDLTAKGQHAARVLLASHGLGEHMTPAHARMLLEALKEHADRTGGNVLVVGRALARPPGSTTWEVRQAREDLE